MDIQKKKNITYIDIYLEEYRTVREEILLRLKERNTIVRYILLLISALIVAIWQISSSEVQPQKTLVIFLVIIPTIFFLLALIYCWHDIMIARLANYNNKILRPKLAEVCQNKNILAWEKYLHKQRKSLFWKCMSFLNRLILVVPIPLSIISMYALIKPDIFSTIKIILAIFTLLLFIAVLVLFLFIDCMYCQSGK